MDPVFMETKDCCESFGSCIRVNKSVGSEDSSLTVLNIDEYGLATNAYLIQNH